MRIRLTHRQVEILQEVYSKKSLDLATTWNIGHKMRILRVLDDYKFFNIVNSKQGSSWSLSKLGLQVMEKINSNDISTKNKEFVDILM